MYSDGLGRADVGYEEGKGAEGHWQRKLFKVWSNKMEHHSRSRISSRECRRLPKSLKKAPSCPNTRSRCRDKVCLKHRSKSQRSPHLVLTDNLPPCLHCRRSRHSRDYTLKRGQDATEAFKSLHQAQREACISLMPQWKSHPHSMTLIRTPILKTTTSRTTVHGRLLVQEILSILIRVCLPLQNMQHPPDTPQRPTTLRMTSLTTFLNILEEDMKDYVRTRPPIIISRLKCPTHPGHVLICMRPINPLPTLQAWVALILPA